MFRKGTYCLLLCLWQLAAAAQVKLTVVPGKTTVNPNETFQLQFIAEGASSVDEFIPPSFKNFERFGNAVETNGWTWVNGSLTEYVSYTFLLRPKLKGKLSIASAIMKVKGKMLTSPVVSINVTDAVPVNTDVTASSREEKPDYYLLPGEDAKEKIKKNLFVKAFVDKQTCFVGEPLLATFKLYTRLESESKILKRPSFNGFSVIDLEEPEANIFTKEPVNGKLYNCYLIRKVQLFPLQSGDLTIEPVEINNLVHLIKASAGKDGKDWMEALMDKQKADELTKEDFIQEELVTQTPPLKVKVMELPENKPESFNGAVGKFSIAAQLNSKEFSADENGVLKIQVTGSGNLTMINAPSVNWPKGIDAYEPKVAEEFDKTISPITGIKVFEIPFAAVKGVYEIPSVVFTFFDMVSKTYKTIRTDSLKFSVKEAVAGKTGKNLQAPVEAPKPYADNRKWYWWGGGAFAAVVLLSLLLFARKKKTTLVVAEKKLNITLEPPVPVKPAEEYLSAALFVKDSPRQKQFYSLLLDGVQEFLIDRLQLQHTKVNSLAFADALKQRGFVKEAAAWITIVQRCEEVMFSPAELNISKEELLMDAEEMMNNIDTKPTPP
ncbi:MAG: BatD family protein [Chitinophagaceae bacterium]|nr:BatD family protein [Chitinophagaceae bacterium]